MEGLDNRHMEVKVELQARFGLAAEILFGFYLRQSMVTWHGTKPVCEQIGEKKCRGVDSVDGRGQATPAAE